MPGRRLRNLSATRVLRAFERAGFKVDRVAGSHYILVRDGGPTISIPRHDPVKVGLLLSKIKGAGLTYEEFEALL
jgi:predicted RNA binding protein YcfA (HicA-like mRNA interferase family)